MLISFALLIIISLIAGALFRKIGLPELLGMILTGVLLGPNGFDFISNDILAVSGELRTAALIIILIRAGLGIDKATLNKVGVDAFKMSFIPCIFEGFGVMLASHYILGFDIVTGGILGFIIAAVSPAVVVPQMLSLKERGLGKTLDKDVPTLILAGASVDDVFAITIFTVFLNIKTGKSESILFTLLKIPFSIVTGIIIGAVIGIVLVYIFKKIHIRDTKKVLIFVVIAIFFHEVETFVPVATLLGIMAIGFVILERYPELSGRMASKFGKVWVLAEILLFTMIGAKVDIKLAFSSNYTILGVGIIVIGLLFRSAGVFSALSFSKLNYKERLFCTLAYTPKATVQAAIGAIPLSMGVASGDIILAIAVLSIVITAPVGAVLIKSTTGLLDKSSIVKTA